MNKLLIYVTILAVIGFNSGCATYIAKKQWDKAQEQQAVRIEADGNQVLVGVDLFSLDYLKDNWKWAIPAAIVDGLIIYQSYEWIDDLSSKSDNSTGNQRNNSINVSGNSESSISISVSGDSTTTTDTDSTNNDSNNTFN